VASHRDEIRTVSYRLLRARPGTTRLWTIQPLGVWERLFRERSLLVDPCHEAFSQDFRAAYDWMRGQMAERLPGYRGHYPWWAYDYRLDLRSFRHQVAPGDYVLLGLAVPTERVLFSAYGAWHSVLNGDYLPQSTDEPEYDQESEDWDEELRCAGLNRYGGGILPEPWRSRVVSSWKRIFDVEDLRETNTIQACFERLDLAEVVEMKQFSAALHEK